MTTKKAKVFVEGRPSLILYTGELKKLRWEEGSQVSEDEYQRVYDDIVVRRAKLYAMHLLQDQDRTEKELYDKFSRAGYEQETARQAVEYVKKFGYVDDERYASNYLDHNRGVKSTRHIRQDLIKKGIDKETVEALLEDRIDEDDEYAAIVRLLRKRHYTPLSGDDDPNSQDENAIEARKERERQMRYLASKGFAYAPVRYVLQHWDEFN